MVLSSSALSMEAWILAHMAGSLVIVAGGSGSALGWSTLVRTLLSFCIVKARLAIICNWLCTSSIRWSSPELVDGGSPCLQAT